MVKNDAKGKQGRWVHVLVTSIVSNFFVAGTCRRGGSGWIVLLRLDRSDRLMLFAGVA